MRSLVTLRLPVDGYGYLQPPLACRVPRLGAYVRISLPAGAVDWTQAAIDRLIGLCAGCYVQVEGADAQLVDEFTIAFSRQMVQRGGMAAS